MFPGSFVTCYKRLYSNNFLLIFYECLQNLIMKLFIGDVRYIYCDYTNRKSDIVILQTLRLFTCNSYK